MQTRPDVIMYNQKCEGCGRRDCWTSGELCRGAGWWGRTFSGCLAKAHFHMECVACGHKVTVRA